MSMRICSRMVIVSAESSPVTSFSAICSTGDGILTAIKVMEVMLEEKQSLGKLGRTCDHLSTASEECPRQR